MHQDWSCWDVLVLLPRFLASALEVLVMHPEVNDLLAVLVLLGRCFSSLMDLFLDKLQLDSAIWRI